MQTGPGAVDTLTLDPMAPGTPTHFTTYVDGGDYDDTFLHRSAIYMDPADLPFTEDSGVVPS